ncbi:MAG TPA: hydrogen gas-evolving membrane-bound hydrogenase subunit E [Gemmatimonadales bacterium]|nr:hydrogen gas-evolving membrane-bound hydrogenase subunit E [Gemmatimonadales bacterium]
MISSLLALSIAGSSLAYPVARRLGRWAGWGMALLPAALFVAFLGYAPASSAGIVATDSLAWVPSIGIDFSFRLDGFSFLFCLLITGIGTLVVIYSGAYFSDATDRERARFITLILLFMTAMLGAVLADNLIVLYLFWEATSILSFLLIGFDAASAHARRSALMSLRVTVGGGLALLAAIILTGATLGTFSLTEVSARAPELAASAWAPAIAGGLMIGAFAKSAQFPLHFWLPNAMQAPTPASAYLHSATMVKLGIYLLARFEPFFGYLPRGREVLLAVALVTMLVGAFQALRAENFKSVLAYSTVASLGILVMLVALDGPMATVAMMGFIVAHALYKATLFFVAGSVQHATGLSKLRLMGGLGRYLPVTAVAAALASLSMAGLPPFLGFISKEFLFEAQIQSTTDAIPMAVAVLVNAVIVGVAGVVTLRPFFLGRDREIEVRHGERLGLIVGPIILATLGLVISLDPGWMNASVFGPAVAAVYGTTVDVTAAMPHGLSPVLLLSGVVLGIGALIFVFWRPIHRRLRVQLWLDSYDAESAYEALLRRIDDLSLKVARTVQHGDLRGYLWTVMAAAVALAGWGMIASGVLPRIPTAEEMGVVRLGPALMALVGLAGGLAAARARGLIGAMLAVGLAGLITALMFMVNGAPDLALTQFSVESLTVVLLTVALLTLPLAGHITRSAGERKRDMALAAAMSAVLFVALMDMGSSTPVTEVSAFYGERSYIEAFGRNVVNVILVDFRGLDTLGEITVIAASSVLVWSLLGPQSRAEGQTPIASGRSAFIFRFTSPLFFWPLLVLSVITLFRGHNAIGGGFVGGLTAALAFAVVSLSHGIEQTRRRLRIHPALLVGGGLTLSIASGLPGMLVHGTYLTHVWFETSVLGFTIKQGTATLFDMGVYLVVLGAVLSYLFGFQREAAR